MLAKRRLGKAAAEFNARSRVLLMRPIISETKNFCTL